ncbi:hypothetical protein PCS76_22135, partial [Acinetobacter baumannii]|nr:hypothetical protein [Acinetobacter baumannii]
DWEQEALAPLSQQLRRVVLRFGVVVSPQGGALDKMLPLAQEGVLGQIGDGRAWLSWIHLTDLIRVILFALENEKAEGVLNAVAPEPLTNADFSKSLCEAVGRKLFLPVPRLA